MNKALLAILLSLPVVSSAVEWIDLGKSKDKQVQTFLDYDSVKRQDITVYGGVGRLAKSEEKPKHISAIFQYTYINDNPFRKRGLYYSKEQWLVSCEDESYFVKARINYGFKDEVADSWQSNKIALFESDFSYAFPETVGGNAIKDACDAILLKELDSTENYE